MKAQQSKKSTALFVFKNKSQKKCNYQNISAQDKKFNPGLL